MLIVLDEGVPEGMIAALPQHTVDSVGSLGWKGVKNGQLLDLLTSIQANIFITADQNIASQQRLRGRTFAILVLSTNSWPVLRDHIDAIQQAIRSGEPGMVMPVECGRFVPRRFR